MKERWVWFCHMDKGTGVDRECCRAGSKKPTSKALATAALAKHFNQNPSHEHASWGYELRKGTIRRLEKGERWWK